MEPKFKLPTETVELPSKGLLYPKDSPLASGVIEMKYMTAREEDILSNSNYISKGIVMDKLLESLIVNKGINLNELLIGDKNALFVAARILSYGKEYKVTSLGKEITVDLSKLDNKKVDENLLSSNKNEFKFKLPHTDNVVTIKCLTTADEKAINQEIQGNLKLNKNNDTSSSTRLKHLITTVNGLTEKKDVREFVDNFLLAKDAREIRKFYETINPDIDLTYRFTNDEGREERFSIPIGIDFFWPDL